MENKIVTAVQWAPEVHDAIRGAKKAVKAIEEAVKEGSQLVVFPEVWLQGFPYWNALPVQTPEYQAFREALYNCAVTLDSPEIQSIQKAAKKHKCAVVISFHEREGGTIYNTQLFIGQDGEQLGNHRKLVPTTVEKLHWGMGDGSGLDVYDTELGRLGGLLCYEHQMALARYVLCDLNIQIHAACWPGYSFINNTVDASMRHLASENACFVIVAREIMSADRIAPNMPVPEASRQSWTTHGGSAIIAPGGEYLVEPVFDKETLVHAELDFSKISLAKWWVDGAGHYARPDIFRVEWDRRPKKNVVFKTE